MAGWTYVARSVHGIAGTRFDVVDLEECTSLTSLGIIQAGFELPNHVALPTSLERLYLHNVLKADKETQDPVLHLMTNMVYLKVGGRATTNSIMTLLPQLPPSLLELDLWDGVITGLDHLTLLTRLKKLRLPSPPSPQQLSIIKRLRQLRHIEVTTREGATPLLPVSICLHCGGLRLHANAHPCNQSLCNM